MRWRGLVRPALGLLLLLPAGCRGERQAADLQSLSDSLRATLPPVSDDVAATCERQNRLLADLPADERSLTDQGQDCRVFQQVAKRLAQDQDVLLDYFRAVGELARGNDATFDSKLAANQVAVSAYAGLPETVVTASAAAQELLGRLTDLTTRHYRRKQVTAIVRSADPAVQRLAKALRAVVVTDYSAVLLGSEKNFLANYYEGPIAARRGERLTLILVERQYDADREALQKREAAAFAYGEVMTSLADLHTRLLTAEAHGGNGAEATAARASLATVKNDAARLAAAERR